MTEWDRYVAYTCRHRSCQEECINRVESRAAQTKQCRECCETTDASELSSLTHHLPKPLRGLTDPAALD